MEAEKDAVGKRPIAVRNWGRRKSQKICKVPAASTDRQRVQDTLQIFADLRGSDNSSALALTTSKAMREKGQWLDYGTLYVGHTPGVEVGDVFRYRAELMIVNLHRRGEAGIAFIKGGISPWGKPVANSIVVSKGYYANEVNHSSFVYTGSGVKTKHQELAAGNLALANSCRLDIPVRVIGMIDAEAFKYQGLFSVMRFWKEMNADGFIEYKYLMEPCTHQPETVRVRYVKS